MKFAIFSDIHLEDKNTYQRQFNLGSLVTADAAESVALIAGDLSHKPEQVVEALGFWARHYRKVMFVLGNHEFYRLNMQTAIEKITNGTQHLKNVHILNNSLIALDEHTFLWGGTLWTDFNQGNANDMFFAKHGMNDFRLIKETAESPIFTPEDSVRLHKQALANLTDWMAQIHADNQSLHQKHRLLVMTHHAPTHQGTAKVYEHSPLNAAFSSNLDALIMQYSDLIPLWVHGHKHNLVHEFIGRTQVVCHPMGYRDECDRGYAPKIMVV